MKPHYSPSLWTLLGHGLRNVIAVFAGGWMMFVGLTYWADFDPETAIVLVVLVWLVGLVGGILAGISTLREWWANREVRAAEKDLKAAIRDLERD